MFNTFPLPYQRQLIFNFELNRHKHILFLDLELDDAVIQILCPLRFQQKTRMGKGSFKVCECGKKKL